MNQPQPHPPHRFDLAVQSASGGENNRSSPRRNRCDQRRVDGRARAAGERAHRSRQPDVQ